MSEEIAKALSHPLRAQIFTRLGERPGSAKQLSAELDHSLNNTSYHVRRLHELGLLRLVDTVKRRGATERIYAVAEKTPAGSLSRRQVPPSVRDRVSAPTLQEIIDAGIAALEAGTLDARDDSHLVCMPTALDAKGWEEVAAIMDKALSDISIARAQSAKRLAKADDKGIQTTIFIASFESPKPKRKK